MWYSAPQVQSNVSTLVLWECVEYAFVEIYLLLVARNISKYILFLLVLCFCFYFETCRLIANWLLAGALNAKYGFYIGFLTKIVAWLFIIYTFYRPLPKVKIIFPTSLWNVYVLLKFNSTFAYTVYHNIWTVEYHVFKKQYILSFVFICHF